jgi:hypothetical protein
LWLLACLAVAMFRPIHLGASEGDRSALAGAVHNSRTGAPLKKISVVLYPAGGRTTYMTATNSEGVFSFDSVEPGNYRIGFEHYGYQSVPGNLASAITHLDPGQKLAGLNLTAVPSGAISGTILDADGEPLVEAAVHLIRTKWWHGRRVGVRVRMVWTNDLGTYRLENLEPGEYYIRASGPSSRIEVLTVSDGPGLPEMAAIPMFYPRAVTMTGAVPIRVGVGDEVSAIDLRLPMERAFHIRGTVDPPPTDTFTDRAPYPAASHDDGGVEDWAEFFGWFGRDGSFEIAGVPSGNYLVREFRKSETLSDPARARIESGDVSGVRLTTNRFDIGIQARFEGDDSHDLSKWFASLVPVDRTGATLSPLPNRPGLISNVSPGRYILEVFPNEDAYVKQLLVHGREVSGAEFELDSAADQLQIVLAKGTRDISGTFAWPDPRPMGARAILVPEQPRPGDFAIVRQADIDQRGEFTFWGVSPGRYRGFVVTGFDEGLWENRDFFRLVADQGVAVAVPEGASEEMQVRMRPMLLPAAAVERAVAEIGK